MQATPDSTQNRPAAPASKTHCPRGHRLAGANLVDSSLRRGRRSCLVCNRARALVENRRLRGETVEMADAIASELARTDGGRDEVTKAAMA